MVELRYHERMAWERWFPEETERWWEHWMKHADLVLDNEELFEAVQEAQGLRQANSRRRGYKQAPAGVTL